MPQEGLKSQTGSPAAPALQGLSNPLPTQRAPWAGAGSPPGMWPSLCNTHLRAPLWKQLRIGTLGQREPLLGELSLVASKAKMTSCAGGRGS